MTQPLVELVEQFCTYQRKQRGRSDGRVRTYRWILEQFPRFVPTRQGRVARASDLTAAIVQGWTDHMAATDLGLNTLRCRLATLSSLCNWLVKRGTLSANPVARIDRPPRQHETPAVAGPAGHYVDYQPGPTASSTPTPRPLVRCSTCQSQVWPDVGALAARLSRQAD